MENLSKEKLKRDDEVSSGKRLRLKHRDVISKKSASEEEEERDYLKALEKEEENSENKEEMSKKEVGHKDAMVQMRKDEKMEVGSEDEKKGKNKDAGMRMRRWVTAKTWAIKKRGSERPRMWRLS